jgi:hypothetical protein
MLEPNVALLDGNLRYPVSGAQKSLSILRTDIDFFTVQENIVAVEIKVTNDSDRPSAPDTLVLRAAPLGAFVTWQPLAAISIPALAPGKVHYVRWRATVLQPEPLGSPDRVPPRKLLTALGLADDPPDQPGSIEVAKSPLPGSVKPSRPAGSTMPPGLMELLLQETPHWAGNINVMVGKTDVERHRAQALRIYPGRMNLAWFIVGSAGQDAYAFQVHGLGKDWEARLFDMTSREALVVSPGDDATIAPDQWIEVNGSRTMLLALRVPPKCSAETVKICVAQKSTGRNAVVEFSLDPRAAGRGCYSI